MCYQATLNPFYLFLGGRVVGNPPLEFFTKLWVNYSYGAPSGPASDYGGTQLEVLPVSVPLILGLLHFPFPGGNPILELTTLTQVSSPAVGDRRGFLNVSNLPFPGHSGTSVVYPVRRCSPRAEEIHRRKRLCSLRSCLPEGRCIP